MPQFANVFGEFSSTMRGFTVSFLLLMGATPALFAGQLADRFGQLRIVLIGASIFCVGCVLQGGVVNLQMLLVGRALAGVGEGLWLTNVSM
jgi:MFS family permease